MRKSTTAHTVFVALLIAVFIAAAVAQLRPSSATKKKTFHEDEEKRDSLICKITADEIDYYTPETEENGNQLGEIEYACNPVDDNGFVSTLTYQLELPDNLKETYRSRHESGEETFVSIPGGTLTLDSVVLREGDGQAVMQLLETDDIALPSTRTRKLLRPDLDHS